LPPIYGTEIHMGVEMRVYDDLPDDDPGTWDGDDGHVFVFQIEPDTAVRRQKLAVWASTEKDLSRILQLLGAAATKQSKA